MSQLIQIILPKEHGSWSLALEPVALGLLVAPSPAGAALASAVTAGFFLRRPLKLLFREQDLERRKTACLCSFALTGIALAGLLLAAKNGGWEKLWPLLPAALAGLVFVWADSRNEARAAAAEIAGAVTFGILPAAFASIAGWNAPASLALTAMALTRSVPTVLTVRARLRMAKGQPVALSPAIISALIGVGLMVWLAAQHLAPWLTMFFAIVFAVRTFLLLGWHQQITARQIGITEAALGGLMVVMLVLTWPAPGL